MKKLIPFTLERWQQGNCTPKTADGREVKQLTRFHVKEDYPFRGVLGDAVLSWSENGTYWEDSRSPKNLMLEVDCEVVYVSLFYDESDKRYYSGSSNRQGSFNLDRNFIKEIKVEL